MTNKPLFSAAVILALLMPAAVMAIDLDQDLPDYGKSSGVSGNIISVGSDTLANLMTLWAEEFKNSIPMSTCKSRQPALQPRRRV